MNNIVGNRIREERELIGLTQGELAKLVNLSGKAAISNYEKGYSKPDIGMIVILANIFKCTTDYLLGLTDHKKPEIIDLAAARRDGDYTKPLSEETMRILDDVALYIDRKYGRRSPEVANEETNKPGGKTENPD